MKYQGFIGPSYEAGLETQITENLYPEVDDSGGGTNGVTSLIKWPGYSNFSSTNVGQGRGAKLCSGVGRFFTVIADSLVEVDLVGTQTVRGALGSTSGRVSMAENGLQLAIADGGNFLYIYTFSTDVLTSVNLGFPANCVKFMDEYFITFEVGSRNFYISALLDGTSWDPLDYDVKEGASDDIITIEVLNRTLTLIGERTTEFWDDTGAQDFPFVRNSNGYVEAGTAWDGTVQVIEGTLILGARDLNGDGIIVRTNGVGAQRISTHWIEQKIKELGGLANCTSWTYQMNGHAFYVLNFLTATICFDLKTSLWHDVVYTNSSGMRGRHRGDWHVFAFGKHLIGDYETGAIYELSDSVYTFNSDPIVWRRRGTHITKENKILRFGAFELFLNAGNGLDGNSQGSDPVCYLRYSNDGGYNWSQPREAKMGKLGEYAKRVIWHRCGAGRDRVFEVSGSEPIATVLTGASIEVS